MPMKTITAQIQGLAPTVMNNVAGVFEKSREKPGQIDYEEWEEELFKVRHYEDGNGNLVWRSRAIKGLLISACGFITAKPKGKGTKKSYGAFVKGQVFPNDFVFDQTMKDIRRLVTIENGNPSSAKRSKVTRIRPMIAPWSGTLSIAYLSEAIPDDVMEMLIKAGGSYVGLSDSRPEYGRFAVIDLSVTQEPEVVDL